jgi:drug/metabolite transporter (DMT)-like permease
MSRLTPARLGVSLSLAAGVAFAVQPVFGQIALDGGASIASLLGGRYALAAAVLAVVSRRRLRTIPPRVAALAFGLGLALYAADGGLFYAALDRTSAPFATLLHYAHLVVVVGAAALLGRERLDARRTAALVGVLLGVALVGGGGSADLVGIALALASAGAYSAYILVSDRLLRDVDPGAFAALLMAGAATSFLVFGASTGDLLSVGGSAGVAAVLTGALVGSVFAVSAFLGGIRLVGPGTASLLVTVEVPVGLALAATFLGEGLRVAQQAGAALVVGAIVLLQVRARLPRRRRLAGVHVLPVSPAGGEPADALAA